MGTPSPDTTALRARLWVLATVATVIAPHAVRAGGLPLWATATFAGFALWRVQLDLRRRPLPPRWLLLGLALLCGVVVVAHWGQQPQRNHFLTLLVLLSGLKSLEARSRRDWVLLVFLAYFTVLTNLFYNQDLLVTAYLLLGVWLGTASLIDLSAAAGSRPGGEHLLRAGRILLQAIPLTLVLFFLFPRVQGQLWQIPKERQHARSGFSERLAPGDLQALVLSPEIAFRVAFDGRAPRPQQLYWRGLVLERTDGRQWIPAEREPARGELGAVTDGQPVDYTVTLEPHGWRWLFSLERPLTAPPGISLLRGQQLRAPVAVRERYRYRMRSTLHAGGTPLGGEEQQLNLQVPEVSVEVDRLAQRWQRQGRRPERIVELGLEFFSTGGFRYTLTPPPLAEDFMADFLFDTRQGFCEHFAAAYSLLMRLAGVPSRVVVGYQGAAYNPVGNYWVVRQAQAHAWSEVWLAGQGWTRVDPTAVVSPERISGLVDGRLSADAGGVHYVGVPTSLWLRALGRADELWDAAGNAWNQWVLGYDLDLQRALLHLVGLRPTFWGYLGSVLAVLVTAAATALLALWVRRRDGGDPAQLAYASFCRKLARGGLARDAAEGPLHYAERVASQRPELAQAVRGVCHAYLAVRYAKPGTGRQTLADLRRRVRRFRC